MANVAITIEVDPEVAKAFTEASSDERLRIQVLLNLRLKDIVNRPVRDIHEVMDQMAENAAANGLTPEILESILRDEDE